MMPTHLYCLLPATSSVAPPEGVRTLRIGDLTAWVSDTPVAQVSRDARAAGRAAVDHDRVSGVAISQGVTPVPASLADAYADDAELQADVRSHAPAIEQALHEIEGLVEMTTIIAARDASPPPEAPGRGRAYLEQLRGLPDRSLKFADAVGQGLSRFGTAERRAAGARVAISHLIPRADVTAYRSEASGLTTDGFTLVVDGPRAPWSFACFAPRRGTEKPTGHDSGGLGHSPP